MRISKVFLAAIFAIVFSFVGQVVLGDVVLSTGRGAGDTRPKFTAKVLAVDDNGIITFEEHGARRLWGVIPDVSYLRSFLVGQTLRCGELGQIKGPWPVVSCLDSGIDLTARIERTNLMLDNPYRSLSMGTKLSISLFLLATKHAVEFCAETNNAFGTCASDR